MSIYQFSPFLLTQGQLGPAMQFILRQIDRQAERALRADRSVSVPDLKPEVSESLEFPTECKN